MMDTLDLIARLQALGDAEHYELDVAHEALEEILYLRMAKVALESERDRYKALAGELAEALAEAAGELHSVRSVSHQCNGCVSYETANDALNRNHGFEAAIAKYEQESTV